MENELNHLGFLIENGGDDRIVAVSTSAVFDDDHLLKTYWKTDGNSIDSGFQGHMYTRPNDVLVIRLPNVEKSTVQLALKAVDEGAEIWKSLTGTKLVSSTDKITFVSDYTENPSIQTNNIHFFKGNLSDAALNEFNNSNKTLVAFVLNNKFVNSLRFGNYLTQEILDIAQTNTLLMDKNSTMELLQANGVSCALAFPISKETDLEDLWDKLPLSRKWVFKPAGGAAGIGVFGKLENGVTQNEIRNHIEDLKSKQQFPSRSQVQEFVSGVTFGATAFIFQNGQFRIFEIHKQKINSSGRFTGGTWSPEIQKENLQAVTHLYKQLAGIKHPVIRGLICIDFIDDKIIEINPRLTASAPIAHILRMENALKSFAGAGFNFRKIDLNTTVSVTVNQISDGTLKRLIAELLRKYGVYVLPQGINPFGASRFIFVNDTTETVQKEFLESLR